MLGDQRTLVQYVLETDAQEIRVLSTEVPTFEREFKVSRVFQHFHMKAYIANIGEKLEISKNNLTYKRQNTTLVTLDEILEHVST